MRHDRRVKVVGWEEVGVPAGKFRALRIESEGRFQRVDTSISGTAKDKTASIRGFTLTLDKTLVLPVRAKLFEGKSDAIEITFSNGQVNVPIDPATMKP